MVDASHSETDGPAMPDPVRTARRAVRLLMRLGMGRDESVVTMTRVIMHVEARLRADGATNMQWLDNLRDALMWQLEAVKGGSSGEGTAGDRPASEIAEGWRHDVIREAQRRGIIDHGAE